MGANNALAAYAAYSGTVDAKPLLVLVYMALVSIDSDSAPWWQEGHEVLAVKALGRTASASPADLRAVGRCITALLDAGAISVARHSAGGRAGSDGRQVRYYLHLRRTPDAERPVSSGDTGRSVVRHRTVNGRTSDADRPTEEYEEGEEYKSCSAPSATRPGLRDLAAFTRLLDEHGEFREPLAVWRAMLADRKHTPLAFARHLVNEGNLDGYLGGLCVDDYEVAR